MCVIRHSNPCLLFPIALLFPTKEWEAHAGTYRFCFEFPSAKCILLRQQYKQAMCSYKLYAYIVAEARFESSSKDTPAFTIHSAPNYSNFVAPTQGGTMVCFWLQILCEGRVYWVG